MIGIYYWASALVHIVQKTYWISIVMLTASGLNLLMNYLLIPRLGWIGAALSTNISFFISGVGVFIIGMYLYPIPILNQANFILNNISSNMYIIQKIFNKLFQK